MTNTLEKKFPLISIVVPIYKTEEYLRKCVDSILHQTYPNIEVILVDDESPDSSAAICDEYARRDTRVKVIHQKNMGLAGARNSGMDVASGELIAFVDSDDYIEEDMYMCMYESMQATQADIAVCGFLKQWTSKSQNVTYGQNEFSQYEALEELVKNNRAGGCEAWNKLYQKKLFDGIYFPVGRLWEDMLTQYKLYQRVNKIVSVDKALYHYIQREGSILHTFHGIDDCYRVQAFYERAVNLEEQYPELARYSFDGIALECMKNCIQIVKRYHKRTNVFYDTYAIGRNAYLKIKKHKVSSWKKKFAFRLFYGLFRETK